MTGTIDIARLRAERLHRWHLAGNPLAGVDEALVFFRHTGFCFSHRARTFLLPSFVEAIAGSKQDVPAYADASGHPLYKRYVAIRRDPRVRRLVLEAPIIHRRHTQIVRDLVPDFARILADPPLTDRRAPESRAAAERVIRVVADRGALSKRALRLLLARGSRGLKPAMLDRVLLELESRLHLVTVDYNDKEGAFYDLFARAHRALAERSRHRTRSGSLDRVIERYVRSAVVVEPGRVREVFRGIDGAEEIADSLARLTGKGRLARVREGANEWLVVGRSTTPPC